MEIFDKIEQGSEEWFKLRAWVLTWTKLKNIMAWKDLKDWWMSATTKKAMLGCIYELIWWEFSFDEDAPNIKTYVMDKGNELEPLAKIKYEIKTWERVTNVWFVKKNEWLWLSPDWLFPEWEKVKKAIEIKCPLANNSKKFFEYLLDDEWYREYIWQIVHYFIVMEELEELDFVIYNPNLILEEQQIFIKNIKREDIIEDIEKAQKRILIFRKLWLEKIGLLVN